MIKEKAGLLLLDATSVHHGPPESIQESDSFINKKYVDRINEIVDEIVPDNNSKALQAKYISNYGLLMLGNLLKETYKNVSYINGDYFNSSDNYFKYLQEIIGNYDVLVLSATTPQFVEVKKIAEMAKKLNPKIKTIFGGPHSRYYLNHDVDECFDCVAIGYGIDKSKEAIDKFISGEAVEKKIITNYYYDTIKDFSLIPKDKINSTMLYSYINFGCPNDCKYCVEHKFVDKIAMNNLENKFGEISELVNKYGVKFIHIADSDFLMHRKTIMEFISFVRKNNLKFCFSFNTSPYVMSKYNDDPILRELKEIGLVEILIGAEHFSKNVLNKMAKYYDIDKFSKVLDYAKNIIGIPIISLYTLVGLPNEYESDIQENIRVIREFKEKNLFDFTFPKFFVPDSDVYLHPQNYNVIINNENWQEYQRWQLPRPITIIGMTDQQYVNEIIEINKISMEDYINENNCSRSLHKKR